VGRAGDPSLYPPPETPGAVDPQITQENVADTICRPGYTKTVRPPVSYTGRIKRQRMDEYHLPGVLSDYELDHIVPLELGGCPDCLTNLWMEPWPSPGAHEKDRVEDALHREVCRGQISLTEAQRQIMDDWYSVYLSLPPVRGR